MYANSICCLYFVLICCYLLFCFVVLPLFNFLCLGFGGICHNSNPPAMMPLDDPRYYTNFTEQSQQGTVQSYYFRSQSHPATSQIVNQESNTNNLLQRPHSYTSEHAQAMADVYGETFAQDTSAVHILILIFCVITNKPPDFTKNNAFDLHHLSLSIHNQILYFKECTPLVKQYLNPIPKKPQFRIATKQIQSSILGDIYTIAHKIDTNRRCLLKPYIFMT